MTWKKKQQQDQTNKKRKENKQKKKEKHHLQNIIKTEPFWPCVWAILNYFSCFYFFRKSEKHQQMKKMKTRKKWKKKPQKEFEKIKTWKKIIKNEVIKNM